MGKEIKESVLLSSADCHLWARHPYWHYDQKERLKARETYQSVNFEKKSVINLTFLDMSLFSLICISEIDLERNRTAVETALKFFPASAISLKANVRDDYHATYSNERMTLSIVKKEKKRQIIANAPELFKNKGLLIDAVIEESDAESINTLEKMSENKFFSKSMSPPMVTHGTIYFGMEKQDVENTFSRLFFARANARGGTRKSLSLMGISDLIPYSVNISYGEGKNTDENAVLYDGKLYKLGETKVTENASQWSIEEENGLLSLSFRTTDNNIGYKALNFKESQSYGTFNGYFLARGKKIMVEDAIGFYSRIDSGL